MSSWQAVSIGESNQQPMGVEPPAAPRFSGGCVYLRLAGVQGWVTRGMFYVGIYAHFAQGYTPRSLPLLASFDVGLMSVWNGVEETHSLNLK